MLKKMYRLFLGLVVLTGSACVTPTHASSAFDVVLVNIQASGISGAKEEMVSIYNNTSTAINITDWCIKNKSNVTFACFKTDEPNLLYFLPAYSFALIATESFLNTNLLASEAASVIFSVTNQSSGSIVNSSDTISIVDSSGQVVDSKSWASSIPTGKVLSRAKSLQSASVYDTADPLLSWSFMSLAQIPTSQVQVNQVPFVDNSEGEAEPLPTDETELPELDVEPEAEGMHPQITELLADAEGSDTGNEFIEVYNPSANDISLADYKLHIGPSLDKVVSFPAGSVIPAHTYVAYTNSQISYTLLNSSSSVQIEYRGQLVGSPVAYANSVTGKSWASIESVWQYTAILTPGSENRGSAVDDEAQELDDESTTTTVKPCAANQYRSLETNRCRLITTASASTSTPCKVGQERNLETNRCRNIASASSPTPCKEGQERNPETKRCRAITKMTDTNYAVKGVTTQANPTAWYLWLGITGVALLIIGYAIWEWREELKAMVNSLRVKFARNKP